MPLVYWASLVRTKVNLVSKVKPSTATIISDVATTQSVTVRESINLNFIEEFSEFIKNDLTPATKELDLLTDNNRIHIQRLIFTNLVDRFDYTLDKTLLGLVSHPKLRDSLLQDMQTPVTDQKLYSLLLKSPDELQGAVNEVLKNELRNSVLRRRHSKKLLQLGEVLTPSENFQKPRVDWATGKIIAKRKGHKQIPNTIYGYADWLYCRRNAVVHGGGSMKISDQDLKQLADTFRVTPAKSVKLNLGSIKNAATFYQSLITIFRNN